jgi:cellulose synthase/poly-beta-1,6-N-acetylglucosamine synthase-like glycosyltransferase
VTAVSIVVPTRDRPEGLTSCLEAVRRQETRVHEIIVVDSAPRQRDASVVAARYGARYFRLDQPGLSRARNKGAREASGDLVIFLDDDITVATDCVSALVVEFADPRVAAVSGRIRMVGGDEAARAAFESFGGFDPGPGSKVVDREVSQWFEQVNFGGLGTGAMIAIRREVFDDWPGFDERLGRGGLQDGAEENYAYFSLVERGHRVVYSPNAIAEHPAPASVAELRRRLLVDAAGAAAYMTLLAVEHPEHRRRVLAYAWSGFKGTRRDWRPQPVTARHPVVSRWRLLAARLEGPLLYGRMRLLAAVAGQDATDARVQADRRPTTSR